MKKKQLINVSTSHEIHVSMSHKPKIIGYMTIQIKIISLSSGDIL